MGVANLMLKDYGTSNIVKTMFLNIAQFRVALVLYCPSTIQIQTNNFDISSTYKNAMISHSFFVCMCMYTYTHTHTYTETNASK